MLGVCSYNNTKKQNKLKVKTDANGEAEIAMLVDIGDIYDKSFNQIVPCKSDNSVSLYSK